MSEPSLTWLDAWQAPPSFQAAENCVCVDGAGMAPYAPVYDQVGLVLGLGAIGFIALHALRGVHRQVAELEHEVLEPTVVLDVERTRSGIEAKGDVEAHTKRLGRTA